mmetsp:Transcript_8248/g.10470  ORF Transcript_8248/g.10470 Transcript_8248/m.10470 type:complete len:234 (-) Transcript_8248:26-727(-)
MSDVTHSSTPSSSHNLVRVFVIFQILAFAFDSCNSFTSSSSSLGKTTKRNSIRKSSPARLLLNTNRENNIMSITTKMNENASFTLRLSKDDTTAGNSKDKWSTLKQLWVLPVLSLLSGVSPAARIVAESHVSRLPDCPIAHEIDTLLLWPAVSKSVPSVSGETTTTIPPFTLFQVPSAAITDVDFLNVDWKSVWDAYFFHVSISLTISIIFAYSLLYFIGDVNGDAENLHTIK